MFGIALMVFGYAVFYWGLHHFPGVDCPKGAPNHCRYSLLVLLGINKGPNKSAGFNIPEGAPIQFKQNP